MRLVNRGTVEQGQDWILDGLWRALKVPTAHKFSHPAPAESATSRTFVAVQGIYHESYSASQDQRAKTEAARVSNLCVLVVRHV